MLAGPANTQSNHSAGLHPPPSQLSGNTSARETVQRLSGVTQCREPLGLGGWAPPLGPPGRGGSASSYWGNMSHFAQPGGSRREVGTDRKRGAPVLQNPACHSAEWPQRGLERFWASASGTKVLLIQKASGKSRRCGWMSKWSCEVGAWDLLLSDIF